LKRNKHSLSHYKLMSATMGKLIPISCVPVLPGDTVQHATSMLVRLSPLVSPVMHPVHARIHHWYVPNRLVWDDWEEFITGGPTNNDPHTFPTIDFSGGAVAAGDLANYLGLPVGAAQSYNALPFRAYAKIFNEFYRDQDLDTELTIDTTDGVDSTTSTSLQNCRWEKDYFTAARPWTQKGSEVSLPLGTTAPVLGNDTQPYISNEGRTTDEQMVYSTTYGLNLTASLGNVNVKFGDTNKANTGLETDLSNATASTINELREAFGLQRFAEARALYGSRYTEYLRYLGVKSSDARLQRPEYLGGGKQTIQFSEVLQTGPDSSDGGVGNLKGHGIGAMRSNRYRRFFEEHGYIISLVSIKPKAMYVNSVPKDFIKTTKEQYWQKELEHIGQEAIQNQEIKCDHATPTGTFGYNNRYQDYRTIPSSIAGDFDSSLNSWHLGRDLGSDPTLNSDFVKCTPAESRIFQSTTNDTVYIMANHSIQARRLVSKTGMPGRV
jgi:hypothetical protein